MAAENAAAMPAPEPSRPLISPWNAPASIRPSLDERIAAVLPRPEEERWKTAGWRTNLMAARDEAQRARKPIFLWIMVGNPQGCT